MSFKNLPMFNKPFSIVDRINKTSVKNVSILSFGLLSTVFSFLFVLVIFWLGVGKTLPTFMLQNSDLRNLLLCILHSFAAAFGILYASFYIDKNRYDGKIVSPAAATIVVFIIGLLLAWRCYFSNDLDILILIITLEGVMLSIFIFFLAILQYDVVNKQNTRRSYSSSSLRILLVISAFLFMFAIFTYYDYFSYFLTVAMHASLTAFQTDALVLFTYMIAFLCLITCFILMFDIERKINALLKQYAHELRNKTSK